MRSPYVRPDLGLFRVVRENALVLSELRCAAGQARRPKLALVTGRYPSANRGRLAGGDQPVGGHAEERSPFELRFGLVRPD
jgi:hypothetical protein